MCPWRQGGPMTPLPTLPADYQLTYVCEMYGFNIWKTQQHITKTPNSTEQVIVPLSGTIRFLTGTTMRSEALPKASNVVLLLV